MLRTKTHLAILVTMALLALPLMVVLSSGASAQGTNQTNVDSQDWPMVNHDLNMSRSSPQTVIGKSNVAQLQEKWILNTGFPVKQSPLIVGDNGYVQNIANTVYSFDLNTGMTKWIYYPMPSLIQGGEPREGASKGLTYENGVIYAPTGSDKTIVALDAVSGQKIWESPQLGTGEGYRVIAPPMVVGNYIVAGMSEGDQPPLNKPPIGNLTGLNKGDGSIIWQIPTAVGDWVSGANASVNGGGATWSGGSVDAERGVVYIPVGNPSPDFNATTRMGPAPYTNSVISVDVATGKVLWSTPFLDQGTVLPNVTVPDTHDWDTSWGTNLVSVNFGNGAEKVVIGHDKRGDIIAMNATNGEPIWFNTLGYLYRTEAQPSANGSGLVWPGTQNGFEGYTAVDNNTLYADISNTGVEYYLNASDNGDGYVVPRFDAMTNGLGNGSITAIDLRTGQVKWQTPTPLPTWASPVVTNGLVFSGHVTDPGKYYNYNEFAAPQNNTTKVASGIIQAYDKDTGELLWQSNVGAPIGSGGPSVGHGMLLVPTGAPDEVSSNKGGYIVAFGLPSQNQSVGQIPTN